MAYLIPLPDRPKGIVEELGVAVLPNGKEDAVEELRIEGIHGRTRLTCAFGEIPIELIRRNDRVRTKDGRYLPVLDVEPIRLDETFMEYHPGALPIRIPPGAIAHNRPCQELILAPDQVVGGGISTSDTFFCRAKDLLSHPGVTRFSEEATTYYRLHLDEPATVMSEKVWLRIT